MNLSQIKRYLREAPNNFGARQYDEVRMALEELKRQAVSSGNEDFANALWAYEQILTIQDQYIIAFSHMKDGKYYDGWCCLARVEKAVHFIRPHYRSAYKCFSVELIADQTAKFQLLFPYRLFFSIEAVVKRRTCSICGAEIKLRSSCQHKPGQIYNGEFCGRRIEGLELPAVSLVRSPANKECVAFKGSKDEADSYDYSLVSYPVSRLKSPFDKWDFTETKTRHPHSRFKSIATDELCPCESGETYADCCLPEEGVLRPHYVFTFDVVESDWKPELIYHGGLDTTL